MRRSVVFVALLVIPTACGTGSVAPVATSLPTAIVSPPMLVPSAVPSILPAKPTPTPRPTARPTPSPTSTSGSGIDGTVTAGPTCPVERPDQPCPPRPVSATVNVTDRSGKIVATTHSGSDGRYAVAVAPGGYTVTADAGGRFPRCSPTQITVRANAYARADVSCDTGIR